MPIPYLATPYTNYPHGHAAAFREAARITAELIKATGQFVFSPIVYAHPLCVFSDLDPLAHEFWLEIDTYMMERCDTLVVAQMEGWETSQGIAYEIDWFEKRGKPVFYLNVATLAMVRRERAA